MPPLSSVLVFVVVSIGAGAMGCAAPPSPEVGSTEGASSEAQQAPLKTAWPADRQKLVAENHGGGLAMFSGASTCVVGSGTYTLDVAARNLSWKLCRSGGAAATWQTASGSRVLSATELASIDAAMKSVTRSSEEQCAEDMPLRTIAVTSASQGTQSFVDEMLGCGSTRNGAPVAHIDDLFDALDKLAK